MSNNENVLNIHALTEQQKLKMAYLLGRMHASKTVKVHMIKMGENSLAFGGAVAEQAYEAHNDFWDIVYDMVDLPRDVGLRVEGWEDFTSFRIDKAPEKKEEDEDDDEVGFTLGDVMQDLMGMGNRGPEH